MFAPCIDNVHLKKPEMWHKYEKILQDKPELVFTEEDIESGHIKECNIYHKAKMDVLFCGFEMINDKDFYFTDDTEIIHSIYDFHNKTIGDLNSWFKLTDRAIKMLDSWN